MWNGSRYVFVRRNHIRLISLRPKIDLCPLPLLTVIHSHSFSRVMETKWMLRWICRGIRKQGDYFSHWNLYTRSPAYRNGPLKDWDCEGFNGSEWTDSSLLTTQHTVILLYTRAFPMAACAVTTAPQSWDNHRKLPGKRQPTFPPSHINIQPCHSTGAWAAWLRRKLFQIRWFSDCF